MIIRVCDLETCGFPDGDCRIVEVATVDLEYHPTDAPTSFPICKRGRMWSTLVNPGGPIPVTAMAVHHITDEMVKDAPPWAEVSLRAFDVEKGTIFAAHNIRFEQAVISASGINMTTEPWICTYKSALALWPDAPAHNNQALRYWIGLKLADPAIALPHRALGDAYVTAALLRAMLMHGAVTPQQLVEISARPAMLPRFTFGKHAMKPMDQVPTDYLHWIIDKGRDLGEDAVFTATHNIAARRAASKARSPV